MKYLRWIHIKDYTTKYESYIEDESADIIEDESIDPKKIVPVITIEDESIDPEAHRVVLYKWTNNNPKKTKPVIRRK